MSRRKYFAVKGCGSFPFALLSRDECFPANVMEAEKITLACPTVAPEQQITLCTTTDGAPRSQLWRDARWPIQLIE